MPRTGGSHRPPGSARAERGWRGENDQSEKSKTLRPDQSRALRQPEVISKNLPEAVPREAGEPMGTCPFRSTEAESEGCEAQWTSRPDQARDHHAKGRKESQPGRQAHDAQRQEPDELLAADDESCAQPPQSAEEIAKSEAPADDKGRAHHPAEATFACAIDEPGEQGKRNCQSGQCADRRQRQ